LASRLKARFGTGGSTEYVQTWKQKATPLGRSYWAHTASARRTSDSDSTGWPTPDTGREESLKSWRGRLERMKGRHPDKGGMGSTGPLHIAAQLAGWPTPTATEQKESSEAKVARGAHAGLNLSVAARYAGWVTPSVFDATNRNTPETFAARQEANANTGGKTAAKDLAVQAQLTPGPTPSSSPAGTGSGGAPPRLNPAFSLWLMGFPPSWMTSGVRAATAFRSRGRSRGASRS